MSALVTLLQFCVIAVCLGWLIALLATPHKTALHLVWGVFCGSLCLMMIKLALADQLGDYRFLIGMGACATCNAFWLVSRGVFRPAPAFDARHVLIASSVAIPVMLAQMLHWLSARALVGDSVHQYTVGALSGWLQLMGSGMLLLAFWEAFRSRPDSPSEQRLRRRFLLTYSGCVLACTVWSTPGQHPGAALSQVEPLLQVLSSLAILLVAGQAVVHRSRHPLPNESVETATEAVRSPADSDLELARLIERRVVQDALYLDPELKVASLAEALQTPEYKVSRAISLGLQQPNFNRFINTYRIDHARRLLADPALGSRSILSIGMDSGFASIGPFNRAFKAATGVTPSAFRAAALQGDAVAMG